MKRFFRVGAALTIAGFGVTAHAAVSCTVSATAVAFGVYDPLIGSPLDSTGTVSVTCTITFPPLVETVNYSIDLSAGGGTFLARRMQAGTNQLFYNLYTSAARTNIWGDGSGGTSDVSGAMTIGFFFWPSTRTNTHTVFGRIAAAQDVPPAAYSDTIVVTVTY